MRAIPAFKYWLFRIAFVFLLLGTAVSAQAQTDTTLTQSVVGKRWVVETRDGSIIQGVFLGQTEGVLRLKTDSAGEVLIPHNQIKSTKILDDTRLRDGEYWFENPNATRYLFSPSAYSLKKGEAYYQNTYLVINSLNYGITDNFTIGGGFEFISTLSGDPIFFITPKYTFEISEKIRAGAGLLYARLPEVNSSFTGMGIGYGILTHGNTDDNVTFGLA